MLNVASNINPKTRGGLSADDMYNIIIKPHKNHINHNHRYDFIIYPHWNS